MRELADPGFAPHAAAVDANESDRFSTNVVAGTSLAKARR
jgi:hypothetical protein